MNATIPTQRQQSSARGAWPAILTGGLIAGSLDILAAALINWIDPRIILRFIAGGVQGKAALQGGAASAWVGLILQWGMSIVIAAIFVAAALHLRWMTQRWIVAGFAYGFVVFVVMNYVVMPLSAWHRINHYAPMSFAWNLLAMLVFGLIIAFFTRNSLRQA
ncbi:MAG: hypothetical protein U1F23_12240 [Lysobacterales bacterium]